MSQKMLNIFISIHPVYADKIMEGVKTIELRRRFPELDGMQARLFVYSTHPVKSLIGYAEIKDVHHMPIRKIWSSFSNKAHIEKEDFTRYFKGVDYGYAVELKNPIKFSSPVPINFLMENYGIAAPQSYRYLDEEVEGIFSHAHALKHSSTSRHKHHHSGRRQQAS